jgi:hypothetical protein
LPDARVVLPLAIFFVMGAAVVWLLWRLVVAGGRARREAASGAATAEIARRADTMLGDLIVIVDEVRRRKVDPRAAEPRMAAAQDALRRNAVDAAALTRGGRWAAIATSLVDDIERAERAIELVEHGSELLADITGAGIGEGETAVKRGYLNLVHARDAIHERRETIAANARTRHPNWGA